MQFYVERDVPIPMRDGVILRADIYRPSEDGEYPALLTRIPYNKSSAQSTGAPMVNPIQGPERGYVIVVQDTRGDLHQMENLFRFIPKLMMGMIRLSGLPNKNGVMGK